MLKYYEKEPMHFVLHLMETDSSSKGNNEKSWTNIRRNICISLNHRNIRKIKSQESNKKI